MGTNDGTYEELLYRENLYPFVECVTFADDVKYNTYGSWQGDYHFNQSFWLNEPGKTWTDYRQSPNKNTLNDGIYEVMDWITEKGSCQETFIYRKVMMLFND